LELTDQDKKYLQMGFEEESKACATNATVKENLRGQIQGVQDVQMLNLWDYSEASETERA
jgi:hypothetical protein